MTKKKIIKGARTILVMNILASFVQYIIALVMEKACVLREEQDYTI